MIKEHTYKRGEIIIHEGDPGLEAYIITAGSVVVSRIFNNKNYVLATLKDGQIFGEMGLIEDAPRSATITALTDVTTISIDRDGFNHLLQHDPSILLPIFRALFERLRTMNKRLLSLDATPDVPSSEHQEWMVILEGASRDAKEALGGKHIEIQSLPFKVGRWESQEHPDVFSDNDLAIKDRRPYHVSRNHFSVTRTGNSYAVVDRGSRLGTIVNGKHIGGDAKEMVAVLDRQENEITVGLQHSPYTFLVSINKRAPVESKGR
jgi:hypothetical protein